MKIALAFTSRLLALLTPTVVLPNALKALPAATERGAYTVTGAVKFDAPLTATAWVLFVPKTTSPFAVRGAVLARATGELNVDAAPTVRDWALLLPKTVLPEAVRSPPTVRVLVVVMAPAAVRGAAAVNCMGA